MKHIMSSVALAALLGACGGSDSPSSVEPEKPSQEIKLRAGDPAEAEAVITAMSLMNSGDNGITYESKSMDGASATFEDVTFMVEEGTSPIMAGRLEFEGLDMVDGMANFSRMTLSDITLPEGSEDGARGSGTVGSIELLNPSPALSAWVAGAIGEGEPADFPSVGQIAFDSWTLEDLDFEFADDDSEGTMSLGMIEVTDLDAETAAYMALSGFELSGSAEEDGTVIPFEAALGSFSMSGLDTSFLTALQENAGDEEAMAEAVMSQMYENPMDPGYDAYAIKDFSFAASGVDFEMPSLSTKIERNGDGQPTKFVTPPFSMKLSADPDGGEGGAGLAQGLSLVNYESIELKGASEGDYDPENDIISYGADDNYFELVDGAKFSFGGKIEGYSAYAQSVAGAMNFDDLAEGAEPDPMAMQQAIGKLVIHDFELRVADDSLVDRVFSAVAAQQGQDPQQMRNQAVMMMGMAPMMAQGTGVDMDIVTELSTAVSDFLADPGTLTIKLDPQEPLSGASMMQMSDPSQLTKAYLGFEATHKN